MGLFDRNYTHSHKHYNETNITEKRAPTDDSIRLLNEMQDKAESNLKSRINVKNNIFELEVFELCDMVTECRGKMAYYKFKLNGKDFSGKLELGRSSNKNEIFKELAKLLSEQIAADIMTESVHRGFWR